MRVIADGPLAAVGSAMPVKIAKGIIAAYPAPFGRPRPLGVPGPLLHLEANVIGVKSDAPQLVNSVHTLDSLHFNSSRSSSLFVCPSLSQPGPSYPLSSSFCFSCPASSPSGTSSSIQGSHPLFLPSSVPCSSSRSEQGIYPLSTSAEICLPTSAISLIVQASTTEAPYHFSLVALLLRNLLRWKIISLRAIPRPWFRPSEWTGWSWSCVATRTRPRWPMLFLVFATVSIWGSTLHLSHSNLPQVTCPLPCFNLRLLTHTCRMNCIKGGPAPSLSRSSLIFTPVALGSYQRSISLASGVLYLIFPVLWEPVSMTGFLRMSSQFSIIMSVDDIIDGIMTYGRGTLMAKFDIESAYCIVPVHLDDRFLLGMQWRGNFFIDLALPFGLHSAPYIFSAVADLLEWIVRRNYHVAFLKHYLDDFHTLGPPRLTAVRTKPCQLHLTFLGRGCSPAP